MIIPRTVDDDHPGDRQSTEHIKRSEASSVHKLGRLYIFYTMINIMHFSDLSQGFDHPRNVLYTRREQLENQGKHIIDLVTGHPGSLGIEFPVKSLTRIAVHGLRHARHYRPDPLGQRAAREAISRYYRTEGTMIPPEDILLTPGTSLSYWYAFKLLANPGDEILCPKPSYPLFETIAALSGVALTSYPLVEGPRWSIDWSALEKKISPRTRALILISPHNPTGAVATSEEIQRLGDLAHRHKLTIIVDEVFRSFLYGTNPFPSVIGSQAPMVITLNGFSKMFGLPGWKAGWMAVTGEGQATERAMRSLEMISDTFLPVNESIQFAIPGILRHGKAFLKRYQHAARKSRHHLLTELKRIPQISFLKPEGGFYLTIRLADGVDEETMSLQLLEKGFLVHPGYFYDLEGSHVVIHFLQKPAVIRRFTRTLRALCRGV
jgi:alanine-synthesizing transaminase